MAEVKRQRTMGWALNRPMLVRNARRAANAANLVRSAMDPRDIDALTPCRRGPNPAGFGPR
jgi:hypothetical protein